jgi:copper oxidase (laccase) domain-containing protein
LTISKKDIECDAELNALYIMNIIASNGHRVGHTEVFCFGPGENRYDWSLNTLQTSQDVADKLHCFELFCRLNNISKTASRTPIHTIYSPRLDQWKANLVTPANFPSEVTHPGHELTLFRGAQGSGMEIPPNTGVFFSTGDCPVVIMGSPVSKRVVAAHAGLRELVDFDCILKRTASRKNESVVDQMISLFPQEERRGLRVKSVCGIGPACYTHPITHKEYGAQNKKLIAHIQFRFGKHCVLNAKTAGRIDLHAIIHSQAMIAGVHFEHIEDDQVDTYTDTSVGSNHYHWWSHRRAKDEEKVGDMPKRNGVLIINPA